MAYGIMRIARGTISCFSRGNFCVENSIVTKFCHLALGGLVLPGNGNDVGGGGGGNGIHSLSSLTAAHIYMTLYRGL